MLAQSENAVTFLVRMGRTETDKKCLLRLKIPSAWGAFLGSSQIVVVLKSATSFTSIDFHLVFNGLRGKKVSPRRRGARAARGSQNKHLPARLPGGWPEFCHHHAVRGVCVQLLGKYEIISEIGRGAMGAVYKARDPLIDRLVALKTITGGPTAQKNLLDRFYQEARSAGALQHPNIVTIYELGHEKNTPFIAMEYLEGESLDRIIDQKPVLPLSVKLGYIARVIDALAYAHQHNVVHRDVKPANIMVTKEGVVKVVDFGIATSRTCP